MKLETARRSEEAGEWCISLGYASFLLFSPVNTLNPSKIKGSGELMCVEH